MSTYIILGVIAGVIVIFIVGISVVEKKKNRKLKIAQDKLEKEIKISGQSVANKIMAIVKTNEENLKNFVPSVGKLKMSDINNEAKKQLLIIKNSKNYRLIQENNEEWINFKKHLEALLGEKSNNWQKRNKTNIDFFANYKPKSEEPKVSEKTKKKGKRKKVKTATKKGQNESTE